MKTYLDLISQVSSKNSVKETDVTSAILFCFKDLKKRLESMDNIEIYMYGLGSFEARRKKIYDLIFYYEAKKRNIQEKKMKENTRAIIIDDCDHKINQLKALHELYKVKDNEKKEFKDEQRQVTGDIQEQKINLGGSEE